MFRSIDQILDYATILVLIGLAAACYVYVIRRQATASLGLFVGGCMLSVLWAALPSVLLGSAYVDLRLLPATFILLLSAIRRVPNWLGKIAALAGIMVFGVRLLLLSLDWHARAASAEKDMAVLQGVREGARIASFAI